MQPEDSKPDAQDNGEAAPDNLPQTDPGSQPMDNPRADPSDEAAEAVEGEVVDRTSRFAPPAGTQPLPLGVRIGFSVAMTFMVLFGALVTISVIGETWHYRDDGIHAQGDPGGILNLQITDEDCLWLAACSPSSKEPAVIAGANITFYVDGMAVSTNATDADGRIAMRLSQAGGSIVVNYGNNTLTRTVLINKNIDVEYVIDVNGPNEHLGIDPNFTTGQLVFLPVGVLMVVGGVFGFMRRGWRVCVAATSVVLATGIFGLIVPVVSPLWAIFGGLGLWSLMRSKETFGPIRKAPATTAMP